MKQTNKKMPFISLLDLVNIKQKKKKKEKNM